MPATPAASLIGSLLSLEWGAPGSSAGNRISIEGVTSRQEADGALGIAVRQLEVASLRLAQGPLALEAGRLTLHDISAQVRIDAARPRLVTLAAPTAELSGVQLQGPLALSPHAAAPGAHEGAWSLAPLAGADGTVRAEIVDAHLMFDADVTVPIRGGQVDFGDATVEHVGPDSRMGVSRLGLYVDAPNGRSYLYQFPATPIAGVEFERRGALLGPFVTDRGKLQLQPFVEGLLRQAPAVHAQGVTGQSRQLFDRTAVSGDVQLGDGRFAAPGMQAEVVGRAQGRNVVRLHSEAVGRGLTVGIAALSVRQVQLAWQGLQLRCEEITGDVMLRVFVEASQLRFALEVPSLKVSGLQAGNMPPP